MENKKVKELQKKLNQAIADRERAKVRYDAHVIIVEGQRRTLSDLEAMNMNLLQELTDAGTAVGEFNEQLKKAVSEATAAEAIQTTDEDLKPIKNKNLLRTKESNHATN